MRRVTFLFLLLLLFQVAGCTSGIKSGEKPLPQSNAVAPIGKTMKSADMTKVRAIYLTPEKGGQLSETELQKHPEVLLVHNSGKLQAAVKEIAQKRHVAIWVDKDSLDQVDTRWLWSEPQCYFPIAVIGYNNSLYAFRDRLGFLMHGPYVDWNKQQLEPGFSVLMVEKQTPTSRSVAMPAYSEKPTVDKIIKVTNDLLEGQAFPKPN